MVLALNRGEGGVAARDRDRILGLEEVEKTWDPKGWMRGQVRYRLDKARAIERRRQTGV